MANAFLEDGYLLLADDTVAVTMENEVSFVQPAFPQRKLCGDVLEGCGIVRADLTELHENPPKYAISMWEQFMYEPRKLLALIMVQVYEEDMVKIEEITGGEKLSFLMKASYEYLLYAMCKPRKEEIQQLVQICNKVPFYVIYRPNEGDSTREQRILIEEQLN